LTRADPRPRSGEWRPAVLIAIFCTLIALIVRWDFAVEQHPPELYLVHDMAKYQQQAARLFTEARDAWDTFTPPGYPLFLALVGSPVRAGPVQAVMGSLTVGLTAVVAYLLGRSLLAALIAGVVCALYAPLVFYTGLLLSETVCAFFLVAFVAVAMVAMDARRHRALAVIAGVLLAVVILTRPSYLALLPFLGWLGIRRRRGRSGLILGWALGACGLVLLPVAVHTSILLGRPALVASNGGVNFFLAHADCRSLRSTAGGRSVQLTTHYSRVHLTRACTTDRPFIDERYFYRRGLDEIAAHPERLLRAFQALGEGLGLAPSRAHPDQPFWPGSIVYGGVLNAFSRAFFGLLLVPAILAGVMRRRASRSSEGERGSVRDVQWALAWCVVGGAMLVLYAFNGNPRVRVSSDPVVIALAACAFAGLARAVSARLRADRTGVGARHEGEGRSPFSSTRPAHQREP